MCVLELEVEPEGALRGRRHRLHRAHEHAAVGGDVSFPCPRVVAARPPEMGLHPHPARAVRRSLTTCTSSARDRQAAYAAGGRSATTITGATRFRQRLVARTSGRRSWPSTDHVTDGCAVGEAELREPAGRPVLQPAQRLDVVLDHVAWYACVACRHSSKVAYVRRRDDPLEHRFCSACARPSRSQSRSGQRSRLHERGVGRHRLRAELATRTGPSRGTGREEPGKSRSSPWYQPK